MKLSTRFILLITVLLAFGFLNTSPASAKDCLSGGTYNSSSNKCEADPACPGGCMIRPGIPVSQIRHSHALRANTPGMNPCLCA